MGNAQSPVPVTAKSPTGASKAKVKGEFDFAEAIKQLLDGRKISKKEWDDTTIYGVIRNEVLILHKDDTDFSWTLSVGDLTGDDWFVV